MKRVIRSSIRVTIKQALIHKEWEPAYVFNAEAKADDVEEHLPIPEFEVFGVDSVEEAFEEYQSYLIVEGYVYNPDERDILYYGREEGNVDDWQGSNWRVSQKGGK